MVPDETFVWPNEALAAPDAISVNPDENLVVSDEAFIWANEHLAAPNETWRFDEARCARSLNGRP